MQQAEDSTNHVRGGGRTGKGCLVVVVGTRSVATYVYMTCESWNSSDSPIYRWCSILVAGDNTSNYLSFIVYLYHDMAEPA